MKKFLASALAAITMLASFGCGGGLGELEYDFTETDEKIEYTFFSQNWQDYDNDGVDRVLEHVENKFNVEITITGASGTNWGDRLATEIADNNTPDMFFALPEMSTLTDYIKEQVITDLDPYMDKANTVNLKQIFATEQYKDTTLVDGKHYFVPQSVGYTTRTLLVRKDWMKKWNEAPIANGGRALVGEDVYKEPKTLSEFTSMLKFFRNGDPDGNGKTDTYGLSLSKNFDFVQDMFATFGIKPDWDIDGNGSFVLSATQPNYANALNWFKDGVEQKYILPDFFAATEDESFQSFYQGESGALISVGDVILNGIINNIRGYYADHTEVLTLLAPPDSDDGINKGAFRSWPFYWGGWCMSADAQEPMRLIKIMDYIFSQEGQKLMVYGVEGVHYTETDGVITPNLDERKVEGLKMFGYKDDKKTTVLDGRYSLGYQLTPCPYKIVDNKLVVNYPYDTSIDANMMKRAYELTTQANNFSALQKIIFDFELNDYNSKIMDAVEIYSKEVISGTKTQQGAYADLQSKLNSYHYQEVIEYLNENAKI